MLMVPLRDAAMTLMTVSFPDSPWPPLALAAHCPLAEVLTVQNSPVLFGCRTGICGTCLVRIDGAVPPPDGDEQELLALLAPDVPHARLACQIDLTGDVAIAPLVSP